MKFVFALIASFVVSISAFAQTGDSSDKMDEAVFEHVPQNLQDQFAFGVHFHGLMTQTGVGLAVETPFAWDYVALRLGVSSDVVRTSRTGSRSFYTGQVALKLQGDLLSSANVYPYVLIGYDAFAGTGSSIGTKSAVEGLIGADWRFVSTPVFRKNERIVRAFFIEAGAVRSSFALGDSTSSVMVSDGFMGRIGFRTFL